ncbi:hypothetical protein GGI11_004590 [Coemansia sp. RSA 2049]|nr:hypothetical protein GGI11_004590 [Coemansia sp. RSA 2049]
MVGLDFSTFNSDHGRLRTRSPLNDSGKRKDPHQAVHLPHDIIHLIVRRFFRSNADVFPVWNYGDHAIRNAHLRQQKLLPLAAVNSVWRRVVTPFLYMSIVCEETKVPASSHSGYNYNNKADTANHCYWRTNLGLFDSSSSKWACRIFVLSSNNGANIESLILALTMQGFVDFSWPSISSLHLAVLSTSSSERSSIPEPIVVTHSTKLARNCPPMLSVPDIGYSGLNGLCTFIFSVIKRMQYNNDASLPSGSSQLLAWNNEDGHPAQNGISRVSLGFPPSQYSFPPFVVTSFQQPRRNIQLSRLKIRYYDMLVDLVAQLSPSLYDLGISDIPQVGILDVLCLGELVPELKSLSLEFAGGNAHFPRPAEQNIVNSAMNLISPYQEAAGLVEVRPLYRLCQLRVKNYPHDIMDCLFSLARGQHLDHIHIETPSISTVRKLDFGMSCLRARSFSLACIGNVHTSDEDARALISTVLSESSSSCMEYLRISLSLQNAVRLEPGPLSSPRPPVLLSSLRSLSLRAPISLEHLTTIISQMPRLRTVKAPYISTAATISSPDTPQTIEELWKQLRQNNRSAIISTSIERMTLGFWDHQQSSRQLCCQILAFVARIPSILSLVHTDEGFAPTLRWTTDCLIMLADSIGGLFGRIPNHMRDLVISNNLGAVRSFS